jgi:type VI protein secretion system component Hcp
MTSKKNPMKSKGLKRSKKLQGVKPLSVMAAASPLNLTQGSQGRSAGTPSVSEITVTKVVGNASPSLFQQATGTGTSTPSDMTTVDLPVVP